MWVGPNAPSRWGLPGERCECRTLLVSTRRSECGSDLSCLFPSPLSLHLSPSLPPPSLSLSPPPPLSSILSCHPPLSLLPSPLSTLRFPIHFPSLVCFPLSGFRVIPQVSFRVVEFCGMRWRARSLWFTPAGPLRVGVMNYNVRFHSISLRLVPGRGREEGSEVGRHTRLGNGSET